MATNEQISTGYIHLWEKNFPQSERDSGVAYFEEVFKQQSQLLLRRYTNQIINSNFNKNAGLSGEILDLLADDEGLVEAIMEGIATSLQQSLDSVKAQELLDKTSAVYKNYSNLLTKAITTTKTGKSAKLSNFFNSILEAISMFQGYDQEFVDKLVQLGRDFSGNSNFSFKVKGTSPVMTLTQTEIAVLDSIYSKLAQICTAFQAGGGTLSKITLQKQLQDIFSKDIAESVVGMLLTNAGKEIENQTDQAFTAIGKRANVTISSLGVSAINTGTAIDTEGTVSKPDMIMNDAFRVSLDVNGTMANFTVNTNFSAKNYTSIKMINGKYVTQSFNQKLGQVVNRTASIGIVGGTTLGRYIGKMGDSPAEAYYVYNFFAHYSAGLESIRTALAGIFFNEWLTGSGKSLSANGISLDAFNTADFLYINGKIVSMYNIIKRISDRFSTTGTRKGVLELSISKKYNHETFQQEYSEQKHDAAIAQQRSRMEQELINSLTIAAHLNVNFILDV